MRDRTPRQRLDVEERREAILLAADELFAGRSFAEVSVADVAAAAGASPALVFHYFGSKAALYAAVVERSDEALAAAQAEADAALSPGVPVRDRVRASLLVYLDHIAASPDAWLAALHGVEQPREATELLAAAKASRVDALRDLLGIGDWARHHYALSGYLGFVDAACVDWVARGCPEADRYPLIDAALGALQGALGDWSR